MARISQTQLDFMDKVLDVMYIHHWGCPAECYHNGDGYPGDPESADIQRILYKGVDVTNHLLTHIPEMEELILKQY